MGRFSDLYELKVAIFEPQTLPSGYNENATDRDGDGLVQDGTEFERPAPVKATRKKSK